MKISLLNMLKSYIFLAITLLKIRAENVLDYVVDCSACQQAPLANIDSFSCNIRCEVDGDVNYNFTGVYKVLEQRLAAVEQLVNAPAFSVYLSSSNGVWADNSIVKYDDVSMNNRNGYDPATGYFTAPVSGIYQFHLHLTTMESKWSHLRVMKGSDILCAAVADGTNDSRDAPTGSCSTMVKLAVGDKVHVYKHQGETDAIRVDDRLNGFTGQLITII